MQTMRGVAEKLRTTLKMAWFGLAIVTTLLVCTEAFAFGYHFVRRTLSGYEQVDAFVKTQVARMPRDGYPNPEDQSWFGPYWKEYNNSTYGYIDSASYSNTHRRPFNGKYINVDRNGRRVTWNQERMDAPGPVNIAVLGAATVWGKGVRDEFTIPSYISKLLAEKYPHRFRVVNYGQDGYVSTQEVITLLREIQSDHIPDIAVFCDGYNEVFAAFQAGAAGIPMNEDERMREFNILHPSRSRDFYFEALSRTNTFQLIQGVKAGLWPDAVAGSLKVSSNEDLARDVVRVYFRNVEAVIAMEKEFGFAVRFFWLPSVYDKRNPTKWEHSIIDASRSVAALYRSTYEAMEEADRTGVAANFRSISNALDGSARNAFIDTSHTTELANETLARVIVSDLMETLEQASPRLVANQKY